MTIAPPTAAPDPGPTTQGPRRWLQDGVGYTLVAWTVVIAATLCAAIAAVVPFAVAAAIKNPGDTAGIEESVQSAPATWATLLVTQVVMLGGALLACRIVAPHMRQRLGLVAPGLGWGKSALLVVATIVPFGVGLLGAAGVHWLIPMSEDSGLTRMWAEGSRATSVLWVLCIGVLPGVVEEIFYRGFLQRGLLTRWPPLAAILVTSALFGISHIEPGHVVFTFVIGVWFGWVAWRTGSVLLPIIMHASMNGGWTALQMIAARSTMTEAELAEPAFTPVWIAIGAVLALGLVAFLAAVLILRRFRPETREPQAPLRARAGLLALAACAAIVVPLYAVIPPGVAAPAPSRAPTYEELRATVTSSADCPADGEAALTLFTGNAARVALPANRVGVSDVIVALDESGGIIWLAYNGEVTGKGTPDGTPTAGIIEELGSGDPAILHITLTDTRFGITARVRLLQDQAAIDSAWERAASEDGWSTRRRTPAAER